MYYYPTTEEVLARIAHMIATKASRNIPVVGSKECIHNVGREAVRRLVTRGDGCWYLA